MISQELLAYIRAQLALGVPESSIRATLFAQRWTTSDVEEAFSMIKGTPMTITPSTPVPIERPVGSQSATKVVSIVFAIAIAIGLIAGTAYAFYAKIGPFAPTQYTASNLLLGLLEKAPQIKTSTYDATLKLFVEPRDAGALPFTVQVTDQEAVAKQYENDYARAQAVSKILSSLKYDGIETRQSIQQIQNAINRGPYSKYSPQLSVLDPSSKLPYTYSYASDGKNFDLTVTFETSDAISAIQKGYSYSATTTIINGQTVTFTRESNSYFYVSQEPPKPFLVQMQELAANLPAEFSVDLTLGATTDWSKADNADFKFNLDTNGDFGDLSYKFNFDTLKKDGVYYFRINNIPSILGSFGNYKGIWITVDPKAPTTTDSYSDFSSLTQALSQGEDSYKKHRAQSVDLMLKAATFASQDGLIAFKNPPVADRTSGTLLYKYDIALNKDAIVPFYKQLVAYAATNTDSILHGAVEDQGLIDYLQSPEFSQVFDYVKANTSLFLWTDPNGFPAGLEYDMRLVPPDTVVALKDKQIKLIYKVTVSNLNKPVQIDVPEGSRPLQDVIKEVEGGNGDCSGSLGTARCKGRDATIQSNLNTIQTEAEIYYGGDGGNTYGPASDSCTKKGTLFTDTTVARALTSMQTSSGGSVTCNSVGKAYAVQSSMASSKTTYWCVDSSGHSRSSSTLLGTNTECP